MSKTMAVSYGGSLFWVYDVLFAVYVKRLILVAENSAKAPVATWYLTMLEHWRANAACSEFGLYLDSTWSEAQLATVILLFQATNDAILTMGDLTADDIDALSAIDELPVDLRGHTIVRSRHLIRFGEAVILLLQNNLPEPPALNALFYGLSDFADMISINNAT